jgi:DNA helicase-2/ATP-dependent DNA helicase PcrA
LPYAYKPSVDDHQQHSFHIGQAVAHAKFGEGVVLELEGSGETERVQVNFRAAGAKWLVLSFANLQAI